MVFGFVAISLFVWALAMLLGLAALAVRRWRAHGLPLIFGSTLGVALAIAAPLVLDPVIATQPGYNGNAAYVVSFAVGALAGMWVGVRLSRTLNRQFGWQ